MCVCVGGGGGPGGGGVRKAKKAKEGSARGAGVSRASCRVKQQRGALALVVEFLCKCDEPDGGANTQCVALLYNGNKEQPPAATAWPSRELSSRKR